MSILHGRDAERNNLLDRIDRLEAQLRSLQETALSYGDGAAVSLLAIQSKTSNPSSPDGAVNLYLNGSKLIAQYDDSGTVRYKYLELIGTGVAWVHTTTAP